MCDIYKEPCKICGRIIPMHLGDFRTDRTEIIAICPKCVKKYKVKKPRSTSTKVIKYSMVNILNSRNVYGYTVWRDMDTGEEYIIVSLTENAWENRIVNHPNIGNIKLIKEVKNNGNL